ncbi:MAG: M20/M25/M40 family metallo-hydrolase [bacterium]|nr:M20/M25/M40 family metallo-hydrolase [bacterium]
MKRLLIVIAILIPLTLISAADWTLVRVPAPDNPTTLEQTGFQLYHRAGDYWIGSLPVGAALPAGAQVLSAYQPSGGEIYRLLLASPSEGEKLNGRATILYRNDREAIIQIRQENLKTLPNIKCEWIQITEIAKPMKYSGVETPATDTFHPLVQEFINAVSMTQYMVNLHHLENYVTRNSRTTQCDNAAAWILQQFQNLGLDAYYSNFTLSSQIKHNVVGELTGLVYPDSVIFITGHYDATAGNPGIAETNAPGADDNGSGTACVLECARILSQYNFEKTIRFVAFAGEEQGDLGSGAYVQTLLAAGTHVVGSFNYDMIAWSGTDPLPRDMVIYTDNNPRSLAMANKIAEAITTFLPTELEPDIDVDPSMGSSDHGPFWDVGWPAVCGIEEQAWGPDFNPYYHTVNDRISICDTVYAVNCTKAAIAAVGDYAIPIATGGPYLSVSNRVITEVSGNGNGVPDPGETINILVTLLNAGDAPATGIAATLGSSSPYLTITQNSSTYPNLNPQQTGVGAQPYTIVISSGCPLNTLVSTSLQITAAGGYQNTTPITFLVGDPIYQPMGPDGYGYRAYDVYDQNGPTYNWIEVDPSTGGQGTLVNFTQDDQVLSYTLPFNFVYYGQSFTQINISTDGWISLGTPTPPADYSNSGIPNADGPPAMIAPFWDDLSPQILGRVAYYHNASQHYYVVEYDSVRQYTPTSARETYEVILYDPAYYPTSTGDGQILIQYKSVTDPTSCTVGIENPAETIGLQYLLDNSYDQHAAPLAAGRAILFTTPTGAPTLDVNVSAVSPPVVIPANGGSFQYNINVHNLGGSPATFSVWNKVRNSANVYTQVWGPVTRTLPGGANPTRVLAQTIAGSISSGTLYFISYIGTYPNTIADSSFFTITKSTVADGNPWISESFVTGDFFDEFAVTNNTVPTEYSLGQNYPNPFNPLTSISFSLPQAGLVKLSVFDVMGREVAKLVNGVREAGAHSVTFDATGLASGVYLYKLEAGDYTATNKMVLMK